MTFNAVEVNTRARQRRRRPAIKMLRPASWS